MIQASSHATIYCDFCICVLFSSISYKEEEVKPVFPRQFLAWDVKLILRGSVCMPA